jgi:DNA-binding response OmpR family regulator
MLLVTRGFKTEVAVGLEEGHKKIRHGQYDLVVLDVRHYAEVALEFCEDVSDIALSKKSR